MYESKIQIEKYIKYHVDHFFCFLYIFYNNYIYYFIWKNICSKLNCKPITPTFVLLCIYILLVRSIPNKYIIIEKKYYKKDS